MAVKSAIQPKLSPNAVRVLQTRYLKKNEKRKVVETPRQMFERVAENIAAVDKKYDSKADVSATAREFYETMALLEFLPNSPTLMNAGTPLQQLAACYVLPVEDDMRSIFDAVKQMALIQQGGGGTGFSFSRLRPKNDLVRTSMGMASGPVSFMRAFNAATDVIKQGGRRKGANMGMLRVDHPDVLEFVKAKEKEGEFSNFNISMGITDEFMRALKRGSDYAIVNPRTKKVVGRLNAPAVFRAIAETAWKNGEPGIVFIDTINAANPTPSLGKLESTNPCIAGDARVSCASGLPSLEQVVERGGALLAVDNRMLQFNSSPCSTQYGTTFGVAHKVQLTDEKETVTIETKSGFELTLTKDHKVMTTSGWKQAEKLSSGDEVLIQSGPGSFSQLAQIRETAGNADFPAAPKKWTREVGRVLGWLVGDGWLSEKPARVGFTFAPEDKAVREALEPIVMSWYGRRVKAITRTNGVTHLSFHSPKFVEFFKLLGVKAVSAEYKEVPLSLFCATEEAVAGFLDGLFTADGTLGFAEGKNAYARLTSKSLTLLKQVQLLLLNLGIRSCIYDRHRPASVRFSYATKNGEVKKYECDGKCFELSISKENLPRFLAKVNWLSSKNTTKIEKLHAKEYYREKFVEKIKRITPAGKRKVYDLSEPATHSFVANGFIVANCGEQPLLPYESCVLGSINLARMLRGKEVDWQKLKKTIWIAVHFLDNVVDASRSPVKQVDEVTRGNRKIGLGVMGFADFLVELGVSYASPEAVDAAEKIMAFMQKESKEASAALAKKRGAFPNYEKSVYARKGMRLRNATTTTIAPAGTLSIIAGCSSGIEPFFGIAFTRTVLDGVILPETNRLFENTARKKGFYSKTLMKKIAETGSVQSSNQVPPEVRRLFVTSQDLPFEQHVRIQAAFQKHVDNAVSKTINFGYGATPRDVEKAFLLAYESGCKGVTVYRNKSRSEQVLSRGLSKAGYSEP